MPNALTISWKALLPHPIAPWKKTCRFERKCGFSPSMTKFRLNHNRTSRIHFSQHIHGIGVCTISGVMGVMSTHVHFGTPSATHNVNNISNHTNQKQASNRATNFSLTSHKLVLERMAFSLLSFLQIRAIQKSWKTHGNVSQENAPIYTKMWSNSNAVYISIFLSTKSALWLWHWVNVLFIKQTSIAWIEIWCIATIEMG